jgi:hypothetical protein
MVNARFHELRWLKLFVQEERAQAFKKENGNERDAADLAQSELALARNETTRSAYSQSFTGEILSHSVYPYTDLI